MIVEMNRQKYLVSTLRALAQAVPFFSARVLQERASSCARQAGSPNTTTSNTISKRSHIFSMPSERECRRQLLGTGRRNMAVSPFNARAQPQIRSISCPSVTVVTPLILFFSWVFGQCELFCRTLCVHLLRPSTNGRLSTENGAQEQDLVISFWLKLSTSL